MRKGIFLGALITATLLVGCGGASREKIEEVQAVYSELIDKHNEVINAYAEIEDESLSAQLNEMAESVNSLGQQDMKDKTNEEIEAIVAELNSSIESYNEILETIKKLKEKKEEVSAVPVTIKNNTGVPIYELYLYEVSLTEKGNNLVDKIGLLEGYGTINILNFYMTDTKRLWHLEAYDEDNNKIEDVDVDFTGYGEEGAIVRMEFSFDTMEGWIEMDN